MKTKGWRAPGGVRGANLRLPLMAASAVIAAVSPGVALAGEVHDTWHLPSLSVPEAARPAPPNVFGTVALPVRARQAGTRWTKLMRASLDQPALKRLTAQVRGHSQLQQAAFIQAAVSRSMRARDGSLDCSDDGYWAAGGETLTRGLGDCFDVAVAKMEALRSLGFAQQDLYLTTGYFHSRTGRGRSRGTAALLVRIDSGFLLLPDGSEPMIEASHEGDRSGAFQPYITHGYARTWVHGRVVKPASSVAPQDRPLAAFSR